MLATKSNSDFPEGPQGLSGILVRDGRLKIPARYASGKSQFFLVGGSKAHFRLHMRFQ